MKGIINILLVVCLGFSCSGQNSELQKEDKEIISKLIDELSYATPPPPPIGSTDTIIPQRIVDSLLSIKLRIGLYSIMSDGIDSIWQNQLPDAYKELVESTKLEDQMITSIEGIESKKGHHIIKVVDRTEIKAGTGFTNIDLLYHFSPIYYGTDKTTAVLEVGISRGRMDGSAVILCLEKQQGKWSIQCAIPTTSS